MDNFEKIIGPMVAHTTTESARIWLRASKTIIDDDLEIVARLSRKGTDFTEIDTQKFTFISDFDNVGLIEFSDLTPNTKYSYRIEAPDTNTTVLGLEKPIEGSFKTFSDNTGSEISFITGSCRHLAVGSDHPSPYEEEFMMPKGTAKYGDKAFKSINENKDLNPDFMIMSGDQVYCDHEKGSFTKSKPAKTELQYLGHYHRAYTQPNFSSLASKIPIYMAMDDHEIKNDWHMDMINGKHDEDYKDNFQHYTNGLKAYNIYQTALSSAIKSESGNQPRKKFKTQLETLSNTDLEAPSTPKAYYEDSKNLFYKFSHGPARVFSLDVRLERYMQPDPPQMISKRQQEKLQDWLRDNKSDDLVKFIVSAVPVFPDTKNPWYYPFGAPEDKWAGYAEQRLKILDFIQSEGIRKVVFLSGDVHVSLAAKLQHNNEDIGVYSIISSAFTWPVPGLQRSNFDWKSLPEKSTAKKDKNNKKEKNLPDTRTRGNFKPVPLTKWTYFKSKHREHNFCYVKTDGKKLEIQFHDARTGELFDYIKEDL